MVFLLERERSSGQYCACIPEQNQLLYRTSYCVLSENLHATPRPCPLNLFVLLLESVATACFLLTRSAGKGVLASGWRSCYMEFLIFYRECV